MNLGAQLGILLFIAWWCRDRRINQPNIYYVKDVGNGFNARTVPPFGIFINESQKGNVALLEHELVHWNQYQELGLLGFYDQYLNEANQYGYDNIPMEVQARFLECEYCRYNYTECVRNGWAITVHNPNFRML